MSDTAPQQVEMTRPATVSLPLFQWNALLGCLRTGRGETFTWETTNPLIAAISQQLQQQMFRQPDLMPSGLGGRSNGEDHGKSGAQGREDDARVQRGRSAFWEQNRAQSEE